MTISEMNKVLKEMKEICTFKDSESTIRVQSRTYDPYDMKECVKVETIINDIHIYLTKEINKDE